jgi:hypothetical protein
LVKYHDLFRKRVITQEEQKQANNASLDDVLRELDPTNLDNASKEQLQALYACICTSFSSTRGTINKFDRGSWLKRMGGFFESLGNIFAIMEVVEDGLPSPGKFIGGSLVLRQCYYSY